MKYLSFLVFLAMFAVNAFSQETIVKADSLTMELKALKKRIEQLEEKTQQAELEKILRDAQRVSEEKKAKQKSKVFKGGQRSLQAINPEISVTGDAFNQFVVNKNHFSEDYRSGAFFRVIGLHVQSNLDPFSFAKVAIEFTPHGVGFGEAYATWNNLLPNISVTVGKFRQQFGVVNRWHEHALDQMDFPLALQTILGEEGLNQTGFSFNWLMPSLTAGANALTVEITNGQNEHLFAGKLFSFPVILAHFKNYYDLSKNTYLEFGLTGMVGQNNSRGYDGGELILEDTRYSRIAGLDLSFLWEPLNKARYHSFLWRSELYYADKEQAVDEKIKALGGYSYVDFKLNRRLNAGLRVDYTQPFELENSDLYLYQFVPYLTFWQSPWVKMRLQYNLLNGNKMDDVIQRVIFQITWAAGPHKHERY